MVLNTDHYVYVKSDDYSWRPGKLLDQDGTTATVSVPKFPTKIVALIMLAQPWEKCDQY